MQGVIDADKLCMGCMAMLENANEPCPKCGFDIQKNITSPHQLKPYTILNGKYLIGRVLGEGGFGITYLGWDLNLEIKAAIKEYYPSGLVTREITSTGTSTVTPFSGEKSEFYRSGLDKFINEARSLAKFYALPGIVSVKDFFRENGTAYIVMEFVDGITLKQHLSASGGKLKPDEVFGLMQPVMKSLSQIHADGIIHRDISPDNIMLTGKGDVKLLDFGAARNFLTDGNKSMSVLLKPGYAPEEQYRTRGHQGPWTDVYALCATIYKMITGVTPPESLERYSSDELVRPSQMGVVILQQAENALVKGMAVFEKDRYHSIDELYKGIYGTAQENKPYPVYIDDQLDREISRNKASAAMEQAVKNISKNDGSNCKPDISASTGKGRRLTGGKKLPIAVICAVFIMAAVILTAGLFSSNRNGKEGGSSPAGSEGTQGVETEGAGNTSANLINGGLAAKQDEWIYYSDSSDSGYLYKIRTDGTEKGKLNSDISIYINAAGDWIYYCNKGDNLSIYKIRTDGTERTKLNSDSCYDINAAGEWIYYGNESDHGYLYKIRTDGTEKTLLVSESAHFISLVGDWIYYANDSDYIYKVRTDGTEKARVMDEQIFNLYVAGDWIYYEKISNITFYKMPVNGTDSTVITEDPVGDVNIDGDWVYYSIYGIEGLYKIHTDGTQKSLLCSDKVSAISVIGDWIYYQSDNDNYNIYKIRTDGTEKQKVGGEESAGSGQIPDAASSATK